MTTKTNNQIVLEKDGLLGWTYHVRYEGAYRFGYGFGKTTAEFLAKRALKKLRTPRKRVVINI